MATRIDALQPGDFMRILNKRMSKSQEEVTAEVLDEFGPLVQAAFRRRMAGRLAKWGISTESEVRMSSDEYGVAVHLKIPRALAVSGDTQVIEDSVLGCPEKREPK